MNAMVLAISAQQVIRDERDISQLVIRDALGQCMV